MSLINRLALFQRDPIADICLSQRDTHTSVLATTVGTQMKHPKLNSSELNV